MHDLQGAGAMRGRGARGVIGLEAQRQVQACRGGGEQLRIRRHHQVGFPIGLSQAYAGIGADACRFT